MKNFYPEQYNKDKFFEISHNYLSKQFSDYEIIFNKIKKVVLDNDFTLGNAVDDVEELISKECQKITPKNMEMHLKMVAL